MLSNELEYCLNDAFHRAREARHEYLTVEHLLLAILDTPKVREILRACGADLTKLKQELKDHVDQATPHLEESEEREVQPLGEIHPVPIDVRVVVAGQQPLIEAVARRRSFRLLARRL